MSVPDPSELARNTRRVAEEVEALHAQLERVGVLGSVRRFMLAHQEGYPSFDFLQTAKALRAYAGVLALIAGAVSRSAVPSRSVDFNANGE